MHKIVAVAVAMASAVAFAETYTWNGGASGSWTTEANWSPSTGCPGAGDVAIFEGDAEITSDFEIGEGTLTITNAASTTLKLNCSISGAGGVRKGGGGALHLYKENTFQGKFESFGIGDGSTVSSPVTIFHPGAFGAQGAEFDQDASSGHGSWLYVDGSINKDFTIGVPVKLSGDQKQKGNLFLRNGVSTLTFDDYVYSRFRIYCKGDSSASVVTFNQGVTNSNYAHFQTAIYHMKGALGLSTFYPESGKIYLYDIGPKPYADYSPGTDIHLMRPDILLPSAGSLTLRLSSVTDLHGNGQTVKTLTGFTCTSGSSITSSAPAVLCLTNDIRKTTMFGGTFAGQAGLEYAPANLEREFVFTNNVQTTAGSFNAVRGTIRFAKDAGFTNLGALTVGDQGVVAFNADARAESLATNVTLAVGGKLVVPAGHKLVCRTLTVGETVYNPGIYTATSEGVDFIEGDGEVEVWTGDYISFSANGGNWDDPGAWSLGRIPAPGDRVTIAGKKTVTNAVDTAAVRSIEMSGGATLVFAGWDAAVKADLITLAGTTVTAAGPFTNALQKTRVQFVCEDFSMDATSTIDVDGLGWKGGYIDPDGTTNPSTSRTVTNDAGVKGGGFGPGGANTQVGASHFGLGGSANLVVPNRPLTYDDPMAPSEPGSGGWCVGASAYGIATSAKNGIGSGGGVVLINATGQVTVNGRILASGNQATRHWYYVVADRLYNSGSAGSGGSVQIRCGTIAGSGSITANGGNGNVGAGSTREFGDEGRDSIGPAGAGGGIAIIVADTANQTAAAVAGLKLCAGGGLYARCAVGDAKPQQYVGEDLTYANADKFGRQAEPGVVYLNDKTLVDALIGKGLTGRLVGLADYTYAGDLDWTEGYVRFGETGVTVRVTGNLTMHGANSRLDLGGVYMVTNRAIRPYVESGDQLLKLTVDGDFSIADDAALYVFAAQMPGETTWGAEVAVGGAFSIGANGVVYPTSNYGHGGAPHFTVGSFALDAAGRVDGAKRGGSGAWNSSTYTAFYGSEVRGVGNGAGYDSASAGHGGAGACCYKDGTKYGAYAIPGAVCDDPYRPVFSGAGGGSSGYGPAGDGGGVFHLVADGDVVVDGEINVDGGAPRYYDASYMQYMAAGAGGTICIFGKTFSGAATARLSARGGNTYYGRQDYCSATGGGGRIALWCGESFVRVKGTSDRHATDKDAAVLGDGFANWLGETDVAAGEVVLKADGLTIDPNVLGSDGTIWYNRSIPSPGLLLFLR